MSLENTKRSIRRANRERVVKKAYDLEMNIRYSGYHNPTRTFQDNKGNTYAYTLEGQREWAQSAARRNADHLKSCSCHMCGNPRKYYNEEKPRDVRELDREKNEISEFYS